MIAFALLAGCSSKGSSTNGAAATTSSTTHAAGASTTPASVTAPKRTAYVVDGRAVTMVCKGQGRIPVVFQAGGNDPGTYWDRMVADLGPEVLTCVFDRPGVAPSAPSAIPLTPRSVEKTLEATLAQAHLGPRVVLVGHSIGGLNALVFGAAYPERVAGAVLFDPSEADFFKATHAEKILESLGYSAQGIYADIHAVTKWPSVPLAVLSHDPVKAVTDRQATAAQEQVWIAGAQRYARLSARGTRTVVPGTTHYVYIDAPKVATDAIRRVLHDTT